MRSRYCTPAEKDKMFSMMADAVIANLYAFVEEEEKKKKTTQPK